MRIEDGIFGKMALVTGPNNIDDILPIHDDTWVVTKNDVTVNKAGSVPGSPHPATDNDVLNTDGLFASEGDTAYKYPEMVGKAAKFYTNGTNGNITIKTLDNQVITLTVYAGMMLPFAIKGVQLSAGQSIVIVG